MMLRGALTMLALAASALSFPSGCGRSAAVATAAAGPPPTAPATPDSSGGLGISVKTFGAACDGVTDDSAALQAGLDAAAAQGFALLIPVGLCNFSQTLTVNSGPRGAAIRGERGQGAQGSYLRYTGTGTALSAQNGTSGAFVYNLVFKDFGLVAGKAAALGFNAEFASEGQFRNFSILSGEGRFAQAVRCHGCNILYLDGLVLSGNGAGIELIDPSAIFISNGDFFSHASYVLKLEGAVTHVVVRDSWFEQQDFGLLFDTADVSLVEVSGNRFLFNGGASFPNQVIAEFADSAGGPIVVRGFHFSGNSGYCAPNRCGAPFFIHLNLPASAGASSVTVWVEHNVLLGNNTGIIGGVGPEVLHARTADNDLGDAATGVAVPQPKTMLRAPAR
jgi:hypothetical protein